MSVEKMVDKTKEVIKKQHELNDLVIEMKNEVKSVEAENYRLRNELEFVKKQLLEKKAVEFRHNEPVKDIKSTVVSEVPKEKVEDVKKPVPVVLEEHVEINHKPVQKRERTQTEKNITEFFLGKNVIVKIAAVLMVLAVITFGQIAYVDFLNDVGRFILIMSVGILFTVLGYFFETKKAEVFSHPFYIVGLVVFLANDYLGFREYNLYGEAVFMYYLIIVTIVPIVYFANKRSKFLDTSLLAYFLFVFLTPLEIFDDVFIGTHEFLLITITIGLVGYSLFKHFKYRIDSNNSNIIFDYVILFITGLITLNATSDIIISDSISLAHINVLMYQILIVSLYYVINMYTLMNKKLPVKLVVLVTTSIMFIVLGVSLNETFNKLVNYEMDSLRTLITALLFIPIYVSLYRQKTDRVVLDSYLYILALFAVIFAFAIDGGKTYSIYDPIGEFEPYVTNFVLGIEVFLLLVFSLLTNNKAQKYVSYALMTTLLIFNGISYITDEVPMFYSSYPMYLSLIAISFTTYAIYYFVGEKKPGEMKELLTIFLTMTMIPLVLIFTKNSILDDIPVMITSVVFLIALIRHLIKVNIFNLKYDEQFVSILNSTIVILIFVTNLYYFDHDFTVFADIVKILIVGLGNIYLVYAIRELYFYITKKDYDNEKWFIGLYILGVIIQAIFITTFINFEFDKVILSSYYMIAAAVSILLGFRNNWLLVRKIGLFAIYFSLAKFFVYDFIRQDFSMYVKFISYFTLAVVLFGISALYSYLEKTYGDKEIHTKE